MTAEKKQSAMEAMARLRDCVAHDSCAETECAYYNSWEDLNELAEFLDWVCAAVEVIQSDGLIIHAGPGPKTVFVIEKEDE